MKYLLSILLITMTVFSYGQGAFFNIYTYRTKVLKIPNQSAQEHFEEKYNILNKGERWYSGFVSGRESKADKGLVHFAFFQKEEITYTVVYNIKGEWIATEKRVVKQGDLFDYTEYYPSFDIFSKRIKRLLKKKEYNLNPNKPERKNGSFLDAYEIEVPSTHPIAKMHQVSVFYVVDLDGICIVATEKCRIEMDNRFDPFY